MRHRPINGHMVNTMRRVLLFLLLVLIVLGIGLLHFITPGYYIFYHDTYRRISYLPIVVGAVLFGLRGGLTLAILASIAFIPHLLLFIGKAPETYLSELTEVVLYLAAGIVTGIIAGREAKLRAQYKLLSEKLERSYSQLHNETEQLLEAEEHLAAAQKMSALGELSASLAHEIKNPLSSIRGTAEILLDDYPDDHPKREFVQILLKEATRLNATVEEVLRYSRGRPSEEEPTEPLSAVISRVSKLLSSQLRGKAIDFALKGVEHGDDFYVAGDKLAQVFLNIILNAIDAVPQGGRITVSVAKEGEDRAVTIADNGPGIPDRNKAHIFEPFFSSKEGGTGLGLVISRKIIEGYGGTITVSDSEAGGARFTVFLPPLGGKKVPAEMTL